MDSPSKPHLPPVASPKPTPSRLSIKQEEAKKRQREAAKRRTGWASTIMTRGGNLGTLQTQKTKALGE